MSGLTGKISSAIPSHLKSQLGVAGTSSNGATAVDSEQRRHTKSQSHVVSNSYFLLLSSPLSFLRTLFFTVVGTRIIDDVLSLSGFRGSIV